MKHQYDVQFPSDSSVNQSSGQYPMIGRLDTRMVERAVITQPQLSSRPVPGSLVNSDSIGGEFRANTQKRQKVDQDCGFSALKLVEEEMTSLHAKVAILEEELRKSRKMASEYHSRCERLEKELIDCKNKMKLVDWLELPYDLIVLIANQLLEVDDFLSFSAVCRSWRSVFLNKDWICKPKVPWLMLGELSEQGIPKRKFFSITKFKFYNVPLPEAHGCRCWGSHLGWIVLFGKDFEIRLLNPITRAIINLPSLFKLKQPISQTDWFSAVQKTILLKLQENLVAFVIHEQHRSLSFSKVGDNKWTTVPFSIPVHLLNVVCFKGQILAVTMVGTLMVLEIDRPESPRALFVASPPETAKGWSNVYLAESKDDILLVFRYLNIHMHPKVYKLDILKKAWIEVNDLGERFLLVDDYDCTSCSTYGYFRPNCIYYVHDNSDSLFERRGDVYYQQVVVYNIKEKTVEVFWVNDSTCYTCPVWMMLELW